MTLKTAAYELLYMMSAVLYFTAGFCYLGTKKEYNSVLLNYDIASELFHIL